MKKFIVPALFIISSLLPAKTFTIAYIDTERIMEQSTDTQEAQKLFETEQQNWQTEVSKLETQISTLETEYENKKMILSEPGKEEALAKIDELKTTRDNLINEIYGEGGRAAQKNAELLDPILEKLKNVIKKIAIEEDYSIILDTAAGGVIYGKPGLDITDLVIEELDKAVE